jgi:hypothetical protein
MPPAIADDGPDDAGCFCSAFVEVTKNVLQILRTSRAQNLQELQPYCGL